MGQCVTSCCGSDDSNNSSRSGLGSGSGRGVKTNLTTHHPSSTVTNTSTGGTGQSLHMQPPPGTSTSTGSTALHHQHNGAGMPGATNITTNTGAQKSSSMEKPVTFPYPKFTLPAALSSKTLDMKRTSHSQSYSEHKINALFEMYKDPDDDAILYDGVEKLCKDLEVDPEDFKILLLAWKFNAERMCVFTRPEFIQGCKALRADSIKSLRDRFPELLNEVSQDREKYKDLYRFTFRFGLEPGMRVLPLNVAIALWILVFSQKPPAILERWLKFLDKHEIKGIPRDTWNMFLNFVECVGNDLSLYDDTEAWPSLLDDFVEYDTDARNQNTPEFDKLN